jgi:phosphohistidine phosphatase
VGRFADYDAGFPGEQRLRNVMDIYFLRHALAVERAPSGKDADRSLTSKGQRKTWDSAEAMEKLGLKFEAILSSPYLRARQTAEIVAEAFNAQKLLRITETLAPGGTLKLFVGYVNTLEPLPEKLLAVGHEPDLSQFISVLVSGSDKVQLTLKKGGLCKLSALTLRNERCATLEWLLTPKLMGAML